MCARERVRACARTSVYVCVCVCVWTRVCERLVFMRMCARVSMPKSGMCTRACSRLRVCWETRIRLFVWVNAHTRKCVLDWVSQGWAGALGCLCERARAYVSVRASTRMCARVSFVACQRVACVLRPRSYIFHEKMVVEFKHSCSPYLRDVFDVIALT